MNKTKNINKIFIIIAFLTVFFTQLIFWGASGIIAEERKNNIVVIPLSLTGTGTYLNPYLVNTDKDLNNLCAYTNSGGNTAGVYFKLTSSDLNADGAFVASLTEPIGTATYPFMGIFDGDNITLTGASFTTNANNQAGIFGQVKNATIQNLTVAYNSTNTTATTMGGIVASAYSSNIINCTNKTDIYNTTGDAMIAGIVGYAYNTNIENCTNQATIKCLSTGEGISSAGGIVGYGFNTDIKYCRVIPGKDIDRINGGGGGGSSSDTSYRGGIAGIVSSGKTEESYNMLDITASGTDSSYAGDIVGYATDHTISNCFNRGNISATANSTTSSIKRNSPQRANRVNLSSSGYTINTTTTLAYVGGIAGYSKSEINNCFSIGDILGGKKRTIVENHSHFESEKRVDADNFFEIATCYTYSALDSKIEYDEMLYFSGINGNVSKNPTNCYSDFSNLNDNLNVYMCSEVFDRIEIHSYGNVTHENKTVKESSKLDKNDQKYSNISMDVKNHLGDCSNSYANLNVDKDSISLKIGTTYNYKTPSLRGGEYHHDPQAIKPYSVTYNRVRNYDMYESGTSSEFDGSDRTLPSGFSNEIWAYSSLINDGYPHLIKNYWQNSAKK